MRLLRAVAAVDVALAVHSLANAVLLRRPPTTAGPVTEPICVVLPLRDEAHRVRPCLEALVVALQHAGPLARAVVVDDASTDRTAALVEEVCGRAATLVRSTVEPGPGWLGKPHAITLAAPHHDDATVLVFLDADVVLAPAALSATVAQLRGAGLDLVSPYPRQLAEGLAERLVQPLLPWSWLTLLPLRVAERSPRASLSAANGQLLAVDRATYDRAGGHAAVRGEVVEDIALLRSMKSVGGRGGVTDGTALAACRMYQGWADLRDGWTKSVDRLVPAPALALLLVLYVAPALLPHRREARLALAAAVSGRLVSAARTGGRPLDALAHPASIALLAHLRLRAARHRGVARWKGRLVA